MRLTARGKLGRDNISAVGIDGANLAVPRNHRMVYFTADAAVETPVYARSDLVAGQSLTGPAIIDQLDTTTPIYPGDRVTVDGAGNLMIEIAQ